MGCLNKCRRKGLWSSQTFGYGETEKTQSRQAAGWRVVLVHAATAGKEAKRRHKQKLILRGTHDARREHCLARVDPVVLVAVVAVAEEAAGGVEAAALGGEVRPVPALVPLAELVLRCLTTGMATRQRARVRADCRRSTGREENGLIQGDRKGGAEGSRWSIRGA